MSESSEQQQKNVVKDTDDCYVPTFLICLWGNLYQKSAVQCQCQESHPFKN